MILDLPKILHALMPFVPLLVAGIGMIVALVLVARLAPVLRQRAYDRTSERRSSGSSSPHRRGSTRTLNSRSS